MKVWRALQSHSSTLTDGRYQRQPQRGVREPTSKAAFPSIAKGRIPHLWSGRRTRLSSVCAALLSSVLPLPFSRSPELRRRSHTGLLLLVGCLEAALWR